MSRMREEVYRPPAKKTWSIADAKDRTQVTVTRIDKSLLRVWTPDLGLLHEGIDVPVEQLDEFCRAVAAAQTWTDAE